MIINPTAVFEQNPSKGGVCPVKRFMVAVAASATTDIIPLVTGKKLVILEINIRANSVDAEFQFLSNATAIFKGWAVHKQDYYRALWEIGLFETVSGQKLALVNGSAATGIEVQGSYIEVVP